MEGRTQGQTSVVTVVNNCKRKSDGEWWRRSLLGLGAQNCKLLCCAEALHSRWEAVWETDENIIRGVTKGAALDLGTGLSLISCCWGFKTCKDNSPALGIYSSVVEHLPSMHESLCSRTSSRRNNQKPKNGGLERLLSAYDHYFFCRGHDFGFQHP